jgi:hypothetical protein
MKYQLVLQFPAKSEDDFESLIALEDELIEELGDAAEVDGHDFGADEMNIFIITGKPADTFEKIRPLLSKKENFDDLTAAFRDLEGEDYTTLWPRDFAKKFKVK